MPKNRAKRKRTFQVMILKNELSPTRIILRKNNYGQNKEKLELKKYCPVLRKRLLFKEWKREKHM